SLGPGGEAPPEFSNPALAQVAVIGRRCLLHAVGERGIRGYEPGQLSNLHAFLAREYDLLDESRRVRAERVRAEDAAFCIADEFDEAARRAINHDAIDVGHLHFVDVDISKPLARFRLCGTDMTDIRIV